MKLTVHIAEMVVNGLPTKQASTLQIDLQEELRNLIAAGEHDPRPGAWGSGSSFPQYRVDAPDKPAVRMLAHQILLRSG